MIGRKLAKVRGWGVGEGEIRKCHEEMEEARLAVARTHPVLAALEEEQVRERRAKLLLPALGNITFEREDRSFRFMSCQANNMSTALARDVKVE